MRVCAAAEQAYLGVLSTALSTDVEMGGQTLTLGGPARYTCAAPSQEFDIGNEADVSAAQPPSQAGSWLPRADADEERPQSPCAPTQEGPPPSDGLMRSYTALRRRAEFAAMRRRGRSCSRPTLALYRSPAYGAGRSVAGITVSTSVGKAVVRNRVRRRIAAALHELLLGRTPERLLVIAKPPAAAADFHRLRSDLRFALEAGAASR